MPIEEKPLGKKLIIIISLYLLISLFLFVFLCLIFASQIPAILPFLLPVWIMSLVWFFGEIVLPYVTYMKSKSNGLNPTLWTAVAFLVPYLGFVIFWKVLSSKTAAEHKANRDHGAIDLNAYKNKKHGPEMIDIDYEPKYEKNDEIDEYGQIKE